MREVRPFFAIMILRYMYVFDYYSIGKSIIKSFYDLLSGIYQDVKKFTSSIFIGCKILHPLLKTCSHCLFFIKNIEGTILHKQDPTRNSQSRH
jgi:hypothetical protein